MPSEKNSMIAFEKALSLGFGIETDIRDCGGRLVIAHDPPVGKEVLPFEDFLDLYVSLSSTSPLALNIKSDGLGAWIAYTLSRFGIENYFAFDMSFPELIKYKKLGIQFFYRVSDLGRKEDYIDGANGVWLDSFFEDWVKADVLDSILSRSQKVCIVSPELHGRDHFAMWGRLKSWNAQGKNQLMLCTDYPKQAKEFFYENN